MGLPGPFPYPYAEAFAVADDGLIFMWDGTKWENIGGGDPTAGEPIIVPGTTADYWRGDKTWHVLNKAAVGLANVDNTSDANKPISAATQTALNGKEPTIAAGVAGQYWDGTKTFKPFPSMTADWSTITGKPTTIAGYGITDAYTKLQVDSALANKEPTIAAGTATYFWAGDKTWKPLPATDWGTITNKPATFPPSSHSHPQSEVTNLVSDLALKAPLLSPALTGNPTAPTPTAGNSSTLIATTAFVTAGIATAGGAYEPKITAGTTAQYWRGDKTWQTLDKAAVGLSNVDNTSDASKPVSSATQTALNLKQDLSGKGAANGYASLDASAKVPAAQLPAYVDDVVEYANLAAFPGTGSAGVIYVALDTNKVYRWGGSSYVEISPSPGSTDAVPEGSVNLYYKGSRALADVTWSTITGKPSTFPPSSHSHPQSEVTNLVSDLALKAPLASPSLTGTPTAPTATAGTNTTQLATTAFVKTADDAVKAALIGSASTGMDTLGEIENYIIANINPALGNKADIFSPTFTGDPKAPTPATADNDTSIATTAFVKAQGYVTGGPYEPAIAAGNPSYFWRGDKTWQPIPPAGIPEAPMDGKMYVRQNGAWVELILPAEVLIP